MDYPAAVETATTAKAMERTASTIAFTRIAEFQELAEFHRMLDCGQPNSSPEERAAATYRASASRNTGRVRYERALPQTIVFTDPR